MLLRLLVALLFGIIPARTASAEPEPTPEQIHNAKEDARFRDILELEKANPDFVERYCDQVIAGTASVDNLTKAMPGLMRTIQSEDYDPCNRNHIRDSIKKVYFNLGNRLERTIQDYFVSSIHRIASM